MHSVKGLIGCCGRDVPLKGAGAIVGVVLHLLPRQRG